MFDSIQGAWRALACVWMCWSGGLNFGGAYILYAEPKSQPAYEHLVRTRRGRDKPKKPFDSPFRRSKEAASA